MIEIIEVSEAELDLVVELFDQYRIFYSQLSDKTKAKLFLKERIEKKESKIFIAVESGQAIGFTQLYPSFSSISMKRLWVLNDLFVLPAQRKKSVATKLVKRTIQLAVDTEAAGLVLETAKTNVFAQKLYEKIGFTKSEDFYVYYLTL